MASAEIGVQDTDPSGVAGCTRSWRQRFAGRRAGPGGSPSGLRTRRVGDPSRCLAGDERNAPQELIRPQDPFQVTQDDWSELVG